MSHGTTSFLHIHALCGVKPYKQAVCFVAGSAPTDTLVIDSTRQNLDMLERAVAMMRAHMPREHNPSISVKQAEGVDVEA